MNIEEPMTEEEIKEVKICVEEQKRNFEKGFPIHRIVLNYLKRCIEEVENLGRDMDTLADMHSLACSDIQMMDERARERELLIKDLETHIVEVEKKLVDKLVNAEFMEEKE